MSKPAKSGKTHRFGAIGGLVRLLAVVLALHGAASGQVTVDSTARVDTLMTARPGVGLDSTGKKGIASHTDSTVTFDKKNSVDTIVIYTAKDSIVYKLNAKTMNLFGSADVKYADFSIKSERIKVDWDSSRIYAHGIPDTAKPGAMMGTPVFKEGADEYKGEAMVYNFKSRKGVITQGETNIDNGYCIGERIKRQSENCYFIADGRYTTCDDPTHKHYYFGSSRMKVIPKDVIVAEPVIFFIEDIPVFAIPFAAFQSKSGRSSGIIIPTFGEFPTRGRFLKGGGYYLAASDYWDLRLTGDWYTKGGYQVEAFVQYALKYNLSGSITAAYGHQQFNIGNPYTADDLPQTDYRLAVTHNQTLTPTSSITANMSFQSNSYYSNNSVNVDELLRQRVYSTASYRTSWESNRSLSVYVTRDQDLREGTSTTVLPDISFSQSQIFPFRASGGTGDLEWYELIGFNYSGQMKNQNQSIGVTRNNVRKKESFDRRGIRHSLSLIATPKLGYFTISPSFSYDEKWYGHRLERSFNAVDSTITTMDKTGFYAVRSFNVGVTASTKLYGMFQPNFAGILGIRHTVLPSISWHYNPDFTSSGWGNYLRYRGLNNAEVKYDPYSGYDQRPGELYGGSGSLESQSIGLGIGNSIEMKLKPAQGDTAETPRKFRLLDFDLSTSYDLVRDSLKLSQISLTYRTSIQGVLDISGSAYFSPYVFEQKRMVTDESGRTYSSPGEVNRFMISNNLGLARLTNFSFTLSTSLSNETFSSAGSKSDTTHGVLAEAMRASGMQTAGNAQNAPYSYRIPWSLSLFYSYAIDQFNPAIKTRTSNISLSLNISPTPKWKIGARAYYDLVAKQLSSPEINISRDLHCWQMSFNWVPTGYYRRFYLCIQLKAPQLKDIKLERQGSDREIP